ncbi:BolA family protein [Lysobacter niabensis]|uniref:BolA family protein n=1 Tax=Agrilutibacter niabensis TaxID=380628 RepID=UPI003605D833
MRKAPCDARPVAAALPEHTELNADTIRHLIEQGLPGARADVRGDDGVHFEATVVAEAFRGKLPLARHRMVYATLGERMGGEIHALALKTVTPDEAA